MLDSFCSGSSTFVTWSWLAGCLLLHSLTGCSTLCCFFCNSSSPVFLPCSRVQLPVCSHDAETVHRHVCRWHWEPDVEQCPAASLAGASSASGSCRPSRNDGGEWEVVERGMDENGRLASQITDHGPFRCACAPGYRNTISAIAGGLPRYKELCEFLQSVKKNVLTFGLVSVSDFFGGAPWAATGYDGFCVKRKDIGYYGGSVCGSPPGFRVVENHELTVAGLGSLE